MLFTSIRKKGPSLKGLCEAYRVETMICRKCV
ncbi:MAG: hypothetical protein GF401_18085 [Chitinivibrionales bacterium]|nr:hypothetical protein [Chitinivibrionales bacterium]